MPMNRLAEAIRAALYGFSFPVLPPRAFPSFRWNR